MKKLLALVLALVMSMSLVTISNAAFKDADKISNKEAVDVMAAVGVLAGYDNGEFGATDTLTRAQACKIIAYLDLGKDVAEALPAVQVFSDLSASNWAAKYVAYCADAGYVSGVGDNKFAPDEKVTGYQFGKMLLCALGYDATIEEMIGASWTIKVAKLMEKNSISKGTSKLGSANLTREEAAQYALNALKADMVDYENKGTNITINGAVIATGASKAEAVTGNDAKYGKIENEKKGDVKVYTVQLGEKLYDGKLEKLNGKADDLGRPASEWKYKAESIGTYGNSADATYVLTKNYTIDSTNTLIKVLQDEKLTDNDKLEFASLSGKQVYVNGVGVDSNATQVVNAMKNDAKGGVIVELYYNDDDSNKVNYVVILNYSITQIDDVSTKITKAQKEDGATCKIKVNGSYYTSDKVTGFNAKTYVEDAYLLYVVKSNEIIASQIAAEVTGAVSSTKGSDKATIGGTTYKYVSGVTIAVEDEGTFYLNVAGQIAATDTTSKSNDYIYVYNVTNKTETNSDGIDDETTYTAYYVTADGTKTSSVVKDADKLAKKLLGDNTKTASDMYTTTTSGKTTFTAQGVIAYSINSDKELVAENAKDAIDDLSIASGKNLDKNNAYGTDSDTKFVFTYKDGNKIKTSVATGYKNVKVDNTAKAWTVTNSDDNIIFVFVDNGTADNAYTSSELYAVLLDNTATVTKDGDDTINTYAVAINGEETTLSFKADTTLSDFDKGQVFTYKMGSKYAEDASKTDTATSKLAIAKAGDCTKNYVTLDNTQYNLGGKETIYTVTVEYKKSAKVDVYASTFDPTASGMAGKIDTVTVSEGGKVDKDNYVAYGLDGSDLKVLFVYDFIG